MKGDSGFRFLLAKNIQRPQLKFKDKIDNSNTAFIPKIKYKPNALKPLQKRKWDQSTKHQRATFGLSIFNWFVPWLDWIIGWYTLNWKCYTVRTADDIRENHFAVGPFTLKSDKFQISPTASPEI